MNVVAHSVSGPDARIRTELERILSSATFASSSKLRELLRFAVEKTLSRQQDQLKESVLGVEVYRRRAGYNLRADPIVRVEMHRLREKLREYYASEGRGDALRIEFRKGCYVPTFGGCDEEKTGIRGSAASLIVLPFTPLSNKRADKYFSEGLTEELISALTGIPGLTVIARTSAFALIRKHQDLRTIGQSVNVGLALRGSVRRSGPRTRISVQLVQTADGRCVWSQQFDRKASDVVAVQEEIARALTGMFEVELPHTPRAFSPKYSENVEARELYLKGRYWWHCWGPDNGHKAAEFFQEAIRRDPLFAPAYAGLADCYFLRGYWGTDPPFEPMHKARAAAVKALEIDETLAEAHCSLGLIENAHTWDTARCRQELQRCLELKPGYALAQSKYGTSYLTPLGRLAEARAWIEQAWDLDPLSPQINLDLALNLLYSGRNAEAVEQCRRTIELDPRFLRAYWVLGMSCGGMAAWRDAIEALETALRMSPRDPRTLLTLAGLLAASGDRSRADAVAAEVRSIVAVSRRPIMFALLAAALGEPDQAFEHLEAAFAQRDPHLRLLKVQPILRLLESDPRYARLLQRVGLPC